LVEVEENKPLTFFSTSEKTAEIKVNPNQEDIATVKYKYHY
jgi:hypothetical protein